MLPHIGAVMVINATIGNHTNPRRTGSPWSVVRPAWGFDKSFTAGSVSIPTFPTFWNEMRNPFRNTATESSFTVSDPQLFQIPPYYWSPTSFHVIWRGLLWAYRTARWEFLIFSSVAWMAADSRTKGRPRLMTCKRDRNLAIASRVRVSATNADTRNQSRYRVTAYYQGSSMFRQTSGMVEYWNTGRLGKEPGSPRKGLLP